ncbi:hypothetical protein D3C86_1944190 [compost metagenome]
MLRCQFGLPENFGAQVIAQPGEKRLIEQHATQLPATKLRRQQSLFYRGFRQRHIQHVGADPLQKRMLFNFFARPQGNI